MAKNSTAARFAYTEYTDEELLTLFQSGIDQAIEGLLTRHKGIVWRTVKQYLGSFNDAEDIFQDILLHFLQNKQVFQHQNAKFSSWLTRVVINRCLDILRSKSSGLRHDVLDEMIPTSERNAEDSIVQSQIAHNLKVLLQHLPQQQKRALSLYYYEEMEMTDICAALNLSESAARALLKRGKSNLRDMSECAALA